MSDFALVALPGAYLSSVGAFSDSFLLARDRVAQVYGLPQRSAMETRMRIVSVDGAPVTLSDGSSLVADTSLPMDDAFSFIWLPAFRVGSRAALKERLTGNQPLLAWLGRERERGTIIGASGGAAALLIAAGLTRGLTVPVASALQPMLRSLFPRQRFDERLGLGDSGDILMANGLGNDLSLILRAMERTISPEIARWLTSVMGIDKEERQLETVDAAVSQAQLWLEQHFTAPIRMEALAGLMSCSPSTVNRRFRAALNISPKAYQQKLRLEAAIRMLERTSRSIDRISELVGYSDSRLFRTMFQRHTRLTPSQWRSQARAPLPGSKQKRPGTDE